MKQKRGITVLKTAYHKETTFGYLAQNGKMRKRMYFGGGEDDLKQNMYVQISRIGR